MTVVEENKSQAIACCRGENERRYFSIYMEPNEFWTPDMPRHLSDHHVLVVYLQNWCFLALYLSSLQPPLASYQIFVSPQSTIIVHLLHALGLMSMKKWRVVKGNFWWILFILKGEYWMYWIRTPVKRWVMLIYTPYLLHVSYFMPFLYNQLKCYRIMSLLYHMKALNNCTDLYLSWQLLMCLTAA